MNPSRFADLPADAVAVLGVPFDAYSSFLRGAAKAPQAIRRVLTAGATNWCAENGVDLAAEPRFQDVGDLDIYGDAGSHVPISAAVDQLLRRGARVLALGGDHSISYPIIKAHAAIHGPMTILQLDAHPDLYDTFEDNPLSHACPFARIMEEHLAERLVQIGIRAMNPHQRRQAERFGVEVHEMNNWSEQKMPVFQKPVYLSIDLDALDPAFAPGVSHHEPGGLSVRQVITLIHRIRAPIAGADIVELNPDRDVGDVTAMTAVKLLKEIAGKMLLAGPVGGGPL